MKPNRLQKILSTMLMVSISLTIQAQQRSSHDQDRPFGWAVCTALNGGAPYDLTGGSGGKSITLSSTGKDQSRELEQALKHYDIVTLDGSAGPFLLGKTVTLNKLKGKTIIGQRQAELRTLFSITPEIRQKLDAANIRQYNSTGGGGTLSNGRKVGEEGELKVRQLLIDYLNDPEEHFRNAGVLRLSGCENIIVRNLSFRGPGAIDVGGDDMLTVTGGSTHVWVDHCDFQDGMDANFDINARADFITVSWCKFSYSERSYMHMNTNLVGSNDNPDSQGLDNLNVTYAYCFWGTGCDQRMPMVRFGTIHVLNCLYECPGNSSAVNPRKESEVKVEGCYFGKGVKHIFRQKDAKAWQLTGNHYTEKFSEENQGEVAIPYPYHVIPVAEVPAVLKGIGGAGILREEQVIDNTPDSIAKALSARPAPGTTRQGNNPVLFMIGNSTMRNGTLGNGNNGQWGWGYYFPQYFDGRKISVENQALGGMSTRTFYTDLWPAVRDALKPGDWVLISIGHNDTADFFDKRRARGVIPGVDPDTLITGFNERKQQPDTVYSYGHYLQLYIKEVRARGAHPILMSLTPRDAYDEQGLTVRKPHTQWAAYIAALEGVPFVDLNERSGQKLDTYSLWKKKYHFFGDHIHTSFYGAQMNARSAAEGLMESPNPQLQPLQAMMQNVALPAYGEHREKGKPMVFITGDSTVKNTDNDENGMWGWGSQAGLIFDPQKIVWENVAMAGRSSRSYLREGRWERVYNALQPGDFVLIEFGHNDICSITDPKERGVIPGTQDTCHVYKMEKDGRYAVVYSFGWYLRKMIDDTREKGATPILVSLTPRNEWPEGKIERRNDTYGKWYREVVAETGVAFVDLHNLSADFLDKKFGGKRKEDGGKRKEKCSIYYNHDHTHTSKLGAQMNARNVAKGLREIGSPLANYLLKK